jgi:hypothetical protein
MTELNIQTDVVIYDGLTYTLADLQVNFTQFIKGDTFLRLPDVNVHLTVDDASKLIERLQSAIKLLNANSETDFIVHSSGSVSITVDYNQTDYATADDYLATLETATE